MDLLREKMKASGGLCGTLLKGSSSTTTGAQTSTENNDKRNAVQDGIGVSGDGNGLNASTNTNTNLNTSTSTSTSTSTNIFDSSVKNDPDAVKAIAQAGADIIKSSGGAVVDLARLQTVANSDAWDKTLNQGVNLVDKLIDKTSEGFALSAKVVDSFTPTETKNAEIGKYAVLAAAAVAAVMLFKE